MDHLYPLVCPLPPPDGEKPDERVCATNRSPSAEPMADLPKEIWTRPLTQKEWETACGMIMWWAMHGGC